MTGRCFALFPACPFSAGRYTVSAAVFSDLTTALDAVEGAISVTVEGGDFFGSGDVTWYESGASLVDRKWQLDS